MPRKGMISSAKPKKRSMYSYLRGRGAYKSSRYPYSRGYGRLRGRGAYTYDKPGPWGKYGAAIGAYAGRALGGKYLGDKLAGSLGAKLGSYAHYIGKIFGSGDYITSQDQIKQNTLVNGTQVPSFAHGDNHVRIRHREYLGDVITSATPNTFNLNSFSINPGISGTFPWLSGVVGSNFQQYRINGMVFEYRSMSADALNSTNTALGTVVMATDYDSKDAPFGSKQQMENTEFGVSCKPSSCMIHGIECARSQTSVSELYVRAVPVPSGADIRLYDMGTFYIATAGFQAASVNIGELWVSYDITFFKAIEQPPGYSLLTAHYSLDTTQLATKPIALAPSTLAGATKYDNIGLTVDSTGLLLQFPSNLPLNSVWMIYYSAVSTAGGAAAATTVPFSAAANLGFTNGVGSSGLRTLQNSGSFRQDNPGPSPGPATLRQQAGTGFFTYTGGNAAGTLPTIAFTAPTVPFTAYLSGDLVVTMVNPALS